MKTLTSFLDNAFPFKVEITDDDTGKTQTHEFQDEREANRFLKGLRMNDVTIDMYHNGQLIRSFGFVGEFWE